MKRTLLALAVASVSFAAFAGPPPTAGPVNVNVVSPVPLPVTGSVSVLNATLPVSGSVTIANQPLAVLVSPSITPKTEFFVWGTSDLGNPTSADYEFEFPVLLTGVAVQLQMSPSSDPLGRCNLSVSHAWMDGETKMSRRLANLLALNNGGSSATYVPLPNIYANIGDGLSAFASGVGDGTCLVSAWVYGIRAD
jgi:hypothetical protein